MKKRTLLAGTALLVVLAAVTLAVSGEHAQSGTTDPQEAASVSDSTATLWTCAMHPQIKLSKPGKCPICFMDLIPVKSTAGSELGPRQLRLTEAAKELAQIQTTPVRRATAGTEVRMVGKVAYDETRQGYITAWVPGRLDSLYADYTGITVRKGDPMVAMYSPELLAAQEELIQADKALTTLSNGSNVLKSTATATVDAAREKLRLYGLTDHQIASIESSGTARDHVTIYSPVSGTVVAKNAREGMYVSTGTQIYTIADLSRIWVLFDAYESDLPWLREGQKLDFTTRSLPGENFSARITFIDPVLDQSTRTVKVRAEVDNREGQLKPDMFVSGVVHSRLGDNGSTVAASGRIDDPLVIPASAPLITGTRAVVYVQLPGDDEPLFEGREIDLGPRAGDLYIVKSGLTEGEQVVTNGAFKIDAELQIQAKPSMMFVEGDRPASQGNMPGMVMPAVATTSEAPETHQTEKPTPETSGKAVRASLEPVYKTYFDVQMALASDDHAKAVASYKALANALQAVDMGLFSGESHEKFMAVYGDMLKQARGGAEAKDIKEAREAFLGVSKAAVDMEKDFGHGGDGDYYLTFCPMADNNKGAYWLQTVDTVYNSFYGAAMLRCGSIKEALPAGMVEGK